MTDRFRTAIDEILDNSTKQSRSIVAFRSFPEFVDDHQRTTRSIPQSESGNGDV